MFSVAKYDEEKFLHLNSIRRQIIEEFEGIKYHNDYELFIYARILELSGGIFVLFKEKELVGIYALFRSFLEAYVDLKILLDDPDYYYALRLEGLRHTKNFYESAQRGNKFLTSIAASSCCSGELDEVKKNIKNLEDNSKQEISAKGKFEKAGMRAEYYAVYKDLSGHTHNRIEKILSYHGKIKSEYNIDIVLYGKDQRDFDHIISDTLKLIAEISCDVHKKYGSFRTNDIEEMRDKVNSEIEKCIS